MSTRWILGALFAPRGFLRSASLAFVLSQSLAASSQATSSIDMWCGSPDAGGVIIGTLTLNVTAPPHYTDVHASFQSTVGSTPSLSAAAAACNVDHFNWEQDVFWNTGTPPVDANGVRLSLYFRDPPPGGYGDDPNTPEDETRWADDLSPYWDEGADPPAGTLGFQDGFHLSDNMDGDELFYFDTPTDLAPDSSGNVFLYLVGVQTDGSIVRLGVGEYSRIAIRWSWRGGEVYDWNIPEPATATLCGLGFSLLAALARRRRAARGA